MVDLRALLDGGGPLLADVVATAGAEVRTARPVQVTHRPGRSTTVVHRATVAFPGRSAAEHRVVLHAGRRPPPGASPVAVDDDGTAVSAWFVPADPGLPGLAAVLDAERLRALLADLGAPADGPVTARLRAYRPLRRAVVEVTTPGARLFCKVVRPADAEALHRRHRLLEAALPVPRSAGWSDTGVVVLEALPGRTLRQALATPGAATPPLASVLELLDRLPASVAELPGAASPLTRAADHAALLADVLPGVAGRVQALADAAGRAAATAADGQPLVPTHGDLYEAQLLVDGGRVVGLLDVDGAGGGHRVDDLANLLGHLSVLERAAASKRAGALGRAYVAAADALPGVDPADLRRRVAAVVLGLATGCFRVQEDRWERRTEARIALAEAWLASSARAETRLTSVPG